MYRYTRMNNSDQIHILELIIDRTAVYYKSTCSGTYYRQNSGTIKAHVLELIIDLTVVSPYIPELILNLALIITYSTVYH